MNNTTLPTLHIDQDVMLPDNDQWQFRFEIKSESGPYVYTVAQHKTKKYWGCSCRGWIRNKHCKHLREMGIPGNMQPYEPQIISY